MQYAFCYGCCYTIIYLISTVTLIKFWLIRLFINYRKILNINRTWISDAPLIFQLIFRKKGKFEYKTYMYSLTGKLIKSIKVFWKKATRSTRRLCVHHFCFPTPVLVPLHYFDARHNKGFHYHSLQHFFFFFFFSPREVILGIIQVVRDSTFQKSFLDYSWIEFIPTRSTPNEQPPGEEFSLISSSCACMVVSHSTVI